MSATSTTGTAVGCVLNSAETTRFLELPRELRDRIYVAVLHTSACPPPFPVSLADRLPDCQHGVEDRKYCNFFPRFPLPSTTSALLTLNRQVHAEFKMVISRNEIKRPLIYKLDCIVVHDWGLRPTWLSIPALSRSVDVMEINFRFFGHVNGCCSDDTFSWPGQLGYNLLPLMRHFLLSGPDFLSRAKLGGFKVGELVLNVVSWEEPQEGIIPFERHSVLSRGRTGSVQPNTVVREIIIGIDEFWYTYDEKPVFRDVVQVIRVCLDGKQMHTWDGKGRFD